MKTWSLKAKQIADTSTTVVLYRLRGTLQLAKTRGWEDVEFEDRRVKPKGRVRRHVLCALQAHGMQLHAGSFRR